MRQQLKQLVGLKKNIADPHVKPNDQEMLDNIKELLRKLVVETFVVEKQPPQVKGTCLFVKRLKLALITNFTKDYLHNWINCQLKVHQWSSYLL